MDTGYDNHQPFNDQPEPSSRLSCLCGALDAFNALQRCTSTRPRIGMVPAERTA